MIDLIGCEVPESFRVKDALSCAHDEVVVTGEDGNVFFVTQRQYRQLLCRRRAIAETERRRKVHAFDRLVDHEE